jgi:hypothetical protein
MIRWAARRVDDAEESALIALWETGDLAELSPEFFASQIPLSDEDQHLEERPIFRSRMLLRKRKVSGVRKFLEWSLRRGYRVSNAFRGCVDLEEPTGRIQNGGPVGVTHLEVALKRESESRIIVLRVDVGDALEDPTLRHDGLGNLRDHGFRCSKCFNLE